MVPMLFDQFRPSWFDWVALTLPIFGAWRGGRRGLSEELLPALQWVAILGLGALVAPFLGSGLARLTGLSPAIATSVAYLGLAGVLKLTFLGLARLLDAQRQKLHFGAFEHFVGALLGTARYASMVLLCLAVAAGFDTANLRQSLSKTSREETFESLCGEVMVTLQQDIVERSITGVWARRDLNVLMLKPLPTAPNLSRPAANQPNPSR
jgi:uncharacterized membrane protein required for colicin V production